MPNVKTKDHKRTHKPINWTKVIIAFFVWVCLPIILIVGLIQYASMQNEHELKLAQDDKEENKKLRKMNAIEKTGNFCLKVFEKTITFIQ